MLIFAFQLFESSKAVADAGFEKGGGVQNCQINRFWPESFLNLKKLDLWGKKGRGVCPPLNPPL